MKAAIAVLSVLAVAAMAQRSPYAGREPHGYPSIVAPTEDPLANRFGDDGTPTTTMRLPIEALGDAELVKRLLKLPLDKQPFWLINWQALEINRQKPLTYEQRPNSFIDNPNFVM